MPTDHGGDLPPPVDPAQLDLPARHEAEEQDQCRVFGRQRALRFHAWAKFVVEPLNRVRSGPPESASSSRCDSPDAGLERGAVVGIAIELIEGRIEPAQDRGLPRLPADPLGERVKGLPRLMS
jgi:hypothetical protein